MKLKSTLFLIIVLALFGGIVSTSAMASEVTLAWDANSESNLAGYKLFYKTGSPEAPYDGTGLFEGDSPITINLADLEMVSAPTFKLTGLEEGKTYYLALTAFDTDSLESDYSRAVNHTVNELPPAIPQNFVIVVNGDNVYVITN